MPFTDNEAWTEGMGYPVAVPWKSWAYTEADNTTQVGGYVVKYDVEGGQFEYRTVRSAGHMVEANFDLSCRGENYLFSFTQVPTDAPGAALQILSDLIGVSDSGDVIYELPDSTTTVTVTETVTEQNYSQRNLVLIIFLVCVLIFSAIIGYLYWQITKLRTQVGNASYEKADLDEPLIVG